MRAATICTDDRTLFAKLEFGTVKLGCNLTVTTLIPSDLGMRGLMHSKQILLRSATMKIKRPTATARETLTTVAVMKSASELQDQIRRRAYELYEQHGSNHGHEVSDWLQAESEVAQKKVANAPEQIASTGLTSFN
jgi:hypothetical protein